MRRMPLLSPPHSSKSRSFKSQKRGIPNHSFQLRREEPSQSSEFKVKHKFTLGDTSSPTYCVRFDYNDKYIAASCGDGSIRIFNVFTQKQSYVLNQDMVNKMPTTILR